MNAQALGKVYNVCILVGLAVPLVGLLLSGIGDFFDLDFDFDGDTSFDAPIPVTPLTLSFAAVVFGAIGRWGAARMAPGRGFAVSLAAGVLAACLLGRLVVRPLKRNRSEALRIEQLVGREGRVKLEIRRDFVGTITVESAVGSQVTYDARPAEGFDRLVIGTKIQVVEVDSQKRVCVVSPLGTAASEAKTAGIKKEA